ncbi:carbohydrate binding domain-containing protein [Algibacter pacificus]|uniref:carbohydrate binding domain-containing protein n=1 Tax=Algibacter pacificus TaxID=2599389 RepID=UPI0011C78F9E|nr:carbohydrate binding domain-containing protein [Algibacter pacificus]
MNTIKLKHIAYLFLFVASTTLFSSCDEDEPLEPNIEAIYTANTDLAPNQGFPDDVVVAEGIDLQGVKTITFDDKIDVIFNPVLNSNLAISFSVPYDEAKGSRLGIQNITFTKENGTSFQTEFEILQPAPSINKFNPERPTVGTPVTVNGKWFNNILDVIYQGESMNFEIISSTQLSFTVPTNLTQGGELEIITKGGSAIKQLDIYLGFEELIIADFDGGGLRPNNNWIAYGDYNTLDYKNAGGISGNYAELTWAGATANGYNGSQSDAGALMLEETNPEKVKFLMQLNANGAIGTVVEIFIVDTDGVNWAINYTITEDGWQTVEALVADFGKNYDPSNQSDGDANPAAINQVKVGIGQNSGSPNPSTVQFDNIKWQIFETVQASTLPPTGPKNILLNGDLELGDADNFENWGMWNGADRMTAETTEIHTGERALKVVNPAAGNSWDTQLVSDAVTTEVGKEYTASMYIKGETVTLRFSTNADAGALYGIDYTTTTEWQQVTWDFVANDTATRLVLDMGTSQGTFYIDDIELKEKI